MYRKAKIIYCSKNFYVQKLYLNYISFKAKSKPDIKFSERINVTKCKTKRSVFMFQELLNLEFLLDFTKAAEMEQ